MRRITCSGAGAVKVAGDQFRVRISDQVFNVTVVIARGMIRRGIMSCTLSVTGNPFKSTASVRASAGLCVSAHAHESWDSIANCFPGYCRIGAYCGSKQHIRGMPLLHICKASLPFSRYLLHLPTKGWPG